MTPEQALSHAVAQRVVLAERPRRLELLRMNISWPLTPLRLLIHRSTIIEPTIAPLLRFAAYAGFAVEAELSALDHSLSFAATPPGPFDAEVVWLDDEPFETHSPQEVAAFVTARIAARRAASNAPLLVMGWPGDGARDRAINADLEERIADIPDAYVCPLAEVAAEGADGFYDDERTSVTGSRLSGDGLLAIAQRLGLQWLPAALGRSLRGIAVDLDNTLYDGVLEEDGVAGIEVREEHRGLQRELLSLRARGFFLGIISRNSPADVEDLFKQRDDFLIKASSVDAWGVSLEMPKADSLSSVAHDLRIAPDALLFVDDNGGELAAVVASFPDVQTLHAASPEVTASALQRCPGLFRFRDAGADSLRLRDLAADQIRRSLRDASHDPQEFLASLRIEMTLAFDHRQHLARIAELSRKTNQFSTNLARLTETQLSARMTKEDHRVLSVALRDRLTDSGVIAFLSAARSTSKEVVVEDICISCRALGRGVEPLMLRHMLADVAEWADICNVQILWRHGPRNAPALAWLRDVATQIDDRRFVVTDLNTDGADNVKVEWRR